MKYLPKLVDNHLCRCSRSNLGSLNRPRGAVLFSAPGNGVYNMSNLIPAEESDLKAWLEHLASKIATSGVGVALLDAQITELEKTCAALRDSSQLLAQFRGDLSTKDGVSTAMLADAERRSKACSRTEIDPRIGFRNESTP